MLLSEERPPKVDKRSWISIAALLGFCFIFYFPMLGRFELKGPDEVRYAQVAREIAQGGDCFASQRPPLLGETSPFFLDDHFLLLPLERVHLFFCKISISPPRDPYSVAHFFYGKGSLRLLDRLVFCIHPCRQHRVCPFFDTGL